MENPKNQLPKSQVDSGIAWILLENIFKVIEPLLLFVCAGVYAGGEWGVFKFYESLVYLFFRIALFGLDRGIVWYYHNLEQNDYEKGIFKGVNVIFFFSALLVAFTLWGPADWIVNGFSGKSPELEIKKLDLGLLLMAVPLFGMRELFFQANATINNIRYRILGNAILFPSVAYGGALAGHFIFNDQWGLIRPYLAGSLISFLVAFLSVTKLHNIKWVNWRPSLILPKKLKSYILPLVGADVFSAVAVRVDMFMLAGLVGVKSIEIYNIATMIGKSLAGIRKTFEAQLLGVFSSGGARTLTDKVKQNFNYFTWVVMTVLSFVLIVVVFYGKEFLGLVHPQYVAGYYTLIVACLFYWINVAADFTSLLVLGLGRTRIVPFSQVVFFGGNIIFNLLLIPKFDALGAIAALGISTSISGLIYFVYLRKSTKTSIFENKYLYSVACSVAIVLLPILLSQYIWDMIVFRTGVFIVTICIFGLFNKNQYRKFRSQLGN